jgi:hypothetical protein
VQQCATFGIDNQKQRTMPLKPGFIRQKRDAQPSVEVPSEWPRFTLASLLLWMTFAAILAYVVREVGWWSLPLACTFAPAIVGACVGTMQWSHPDQAIRLVTALLYVVLGAYLAASAAAFCFDLRAGIIAVVFFPAMLALWGVQYATVCAAFD